MLMSGYDLKESLVARRYVVPASDRLIGSGAHPLDVVGVVTSESGRVVPVEGLAVRFVHAAYLVWCRHVSSCVVR